MAADGSVIIEINGDLSDFQRSMSRARQASTELEQELRQVNRSLELDPGNVDLLTQRQELLQAAVRETSNTLDALRRAQEEALDLPATPENERIYRELTRAISDTTQELNRLEAELNDVDREMAQTGDSTGKLSDLFRGSFLGNLASDAVQELAGQLRELAKATVEAAAAVKAEEAQFGQTFGDMAEQASRAVERVSKSTGILETRLNTVASGIYAFARASGGEVEESMALMERSLSVAADSAAYYDRSLEETAETLQSFLKGNFENDAALGLSATEFTRNAAAAELFGKKFIELSEIQKQQTLLHMVEDAMQLSGAMGQASRESDSWANVTGNLQETWRQFLATVGEPALEALIPVIKEGAEALESFTDITEKAIDLLGAGGFLKAEKEFADRVEDTTLAVDAQRETFDSLVESRSASLGAMQAEMGLVGQYIGELQNITDANGNVVSGYEARAAYLADYINTQVPGAVIAAGNEANANYQVVDSIEALIFAKQKEAAMNAYSAEYEAALAGQTQAWQNLTAAQRDHNAAQQQVAALEAELKNALGGTRLEYSQLRQQLDLANESLASAEANLSTATSTWTDYQTAISNFETIAATQSLQELDQVLAATSANIVQNTGDNVAALEKSVIDIQAAYVNMVNTVAAQWDTLTAEEQAAWAEQLSALRTALDAQVNEAREGGVQIPTAVGEGVNAGGYQFTGAMQSAYEAAIAELQPGADVQDIGASVTKLLGEGVISEVTAVSDSSKQVIEGGKSAADGQVTASNFPSVGSDITAGIARGVSSGSGTLNSAVRSVITTALAAAQAAAKTGSPSKLFEDELGVFLPAGVASGIKKGTRTAVEESRNSISAIFEAATEGADPAIKRIVGEAEQQIEELYGTITQMEIAANERAEAKELAQHEKNLKEKYDALEKAELSERQKIQDEIDRLQSNWDEKQLKKQEDAEKKRLETQAKALEDFLSAYEKALADQEKALGEFQQEYQDALADVESKTSNMADRLSDYTLFDSYEGNMHLWDMQPAIDQLVAYGEAIEELRERGVNEGLLSEILEMDTQEALQFSEKLLSMSEGQFDQYMAKWQEKEDTARRVAESIYGAELEAVETEYAEKLPEMMASTADEAMATLAESLETSGQDAVAAAAQVADDILAEIERINAAQRLQAAVQSAAASFGGKLASNVQNAAEGEAAARRSQTMETAGAVAMASNTNTSREIVLNLNGKEVARGLVPDIRSVEDQSPRIVSD